MHRELEGYRSDTRLALATTGANASSEEVGILFLYAYDRINATKWHWLGFHYSMLPPHPTAREIAEVCASAERAIPGLGKHFVDSIASLKNREKHEPDYEAMLQIFSEILVIVRLFSLAWPDDVLFAYEPAGRKGKRPELSASFGGQRFLFEVKAPSLLSHVRARQGREWQVPGRVFPPEYIEALASSQPITPPRDNPVKDFFF